MPKMRSLLPVVAVLGLAGCAQGDFGIGKSVAQLPGRTSSMPSAACTSLDAGQSWTRPCNAEAPLLGKTVVGEPSLDQEAVPTPGAVNPVVVEAELVPVSPTSNPEFDHEIALDAIADNLSPGVARSEGAPYVALKVQTGWNGSHRILYYTVETQVYSAAGQFHDVTGSKVLPKPDKKNPTTLQISAGAVPLGSQFYALNLKATIPSQELLKLDQPPASAPIGSFPAEDDVGPEPSSF